MVSVKSSAIISADFQLRFHMAQPPSMANGDDSHSCHIAFLESYYATRPPGPFKPSGLNLKGEARGEIFFLRESLKTAYPQHHITMRTIRAALSSKPEWNEWYEEVFRDRRERLAVRREKQGRNPHTGRKPGKDGVYYGGVTSPEPYEDDGEVELFIAALPRPPVRIQAPSTEHVPETKTSQRRQEEKAATITLAQDSNLVCQVSPVRDSNSSVVSNKKEEEITVKTVTVKLPWGDCFITVRKTVVRVA